MLQVYKNCRIQTPLSIDLSLFYPYPQNGLDRPRRGLAKKGTRWGSSSRKGGIPWSPLGPEAVGPVPRPFRVGVVSPPRESSGNQEKPMDTNRENQGKANLTADLNSARGAS